nr:MAG TPA: hypothetical protein [Caudoviricetes sp.]
MASVTSEATAPIVARIAPAVPPDKALRMPPPAFYTE